MDRPCRNMNIFITILKLCHYSFSNINRCPFLHIYLPPAVVQKSWVNVIIAHATTPLQKDKLLQNNRRKTNLDSLYCMVMSFWMDTLHALHNTRIIIWARACSTRIHCKVQYNSYTLRPHSALSLYLCMYFTVYTLLQNIIEKWWRSKRDGARERVGARGTTKRRGVWASKKWV